MMQRALRSALVSPHWLRGVVSSKAANHRILDATWQPPVTGRDAAEEFKLKHIPTSGFFDIRECRDKSSPHPFMVASPDIFDKYVGDLGISNDTHVIVYDNSADFPLFSAQRVWWNFRLYGHDKISILDGGLKKWIAEGGSVSDSAEEAPKQEYRSRFQPHLIKNYADILQNMKDSGFQLIDARPPGRFNGTEPEPAKGVLPGCMPNTINIPFSKLLDMDKQALKTPDQLRQVFEEHGVDLNKPLVTTCSVGVTANALVLAAYECGNDQVATYDGSWSEWYVTAPDELKLNVRA